MKKLLYNSLSLNLQKKALLFILKWIVLYCILLLLNLKCNFLVVHCQWNFKINRGYFVIQMV